MQWNTSKDAVPAGHVQITIYDEATGKRIATVFEQESYAKLIAAAPQLLDALVMALPYVETALQDQGYKPGAVDRMVKQIREAIALTE